MFMINIISKTAGSSQSKESLELAVTVHSDSWKQELLSVDPSVKAYWVLHTNCNK